MTVSLAAEHAFVTAYQSLALNCAAQLHIPPSLVLGQWALESAWGTAWYVPTTHNLAGIMDGRGAVRSYASLEAFGADYVGVMRADCPALSQHGETITTAAELFAGTRYNTVNPAYASSIQSVADQIAGMTVPVQKPEESAVVKADGTVPGPTSAPAVKTITLILDGGRVVGAAHDGANRVIITLAP